ncbi:Hypothetical protein R9X50_00730400 [Acrodontium crateriforme]|uniref:Uncharacterized protein n=1 Tax=Acrodontium crateriforme TaxID=150365 RepID=A0AAQ3MBL1_9PEZI|nr:Hypothetical protein R9X50_00730400 [Acrodontium crateriforme]
MASRGKRKVIDLTRPPIDYLTTLPPELIHEIINHLLANHNTDIAFASRKEIDGDVPHPLVTLAASCKKLETEVNQWAEHFFKQHAAITHIKPPPTNANPTQRDWLHGPSGLFNWIAKNCAFCGKKSQRAAILANGLKCCSGCDRSQWPDKITKTDAKNQFALKEHHLLPHRHQFGQFAKSGATLPRLRYGTYMVSGVATTMFLRRDVKILADLVHGDVEEHMKERARVKEERARKKEAKEKKAAAIDEEWESTHTPFQRAARTGESSESAMLELTQLIADHHEGGAEGFLFSEVLRESMLRDTQQG